MNKKSFLEIIECINSFIDPAENMMVKIHLVGNRSLDIALVDIDPHENFVIFPSVTGEETEFVPYENIISLAT